MNTTEIEARTVAKREGAPGEGTLCYVVLGALFGIVLVKSPSTKASKHIERLARRLISMDAGKGGLRVLRTVPPGTHRGPRSTRRRRWREA